MDRGIWATWYDLPEAGRDEYLSWLHEVHIPEALSRPGYLWAAHQENTMPPEREASIHRVLTHINDPGVDNPGVPTGNQYLLLFGAASPHTFVDPSLPELMAQADDRTREMIGRRQNSRYCIFVEEARVDGPESKSRQPGLTPGPVVQLGSFNINALRKRGRNGDLVFTLPVALDGSHARLRWRPQAGFHRWLGQTRHPLRVRLDGGGG